MPAGDSRRGEKAGLTLLLNMTALTTNHLSPKNVSTRCRASCAAISCFGDERSAVLLHCTYYRYSIYIYLFMVSRQNFNFLGLGLKKDRAATERRRVCHIQQRHRCSESFNVVVPRAALLPSCSLPCALHYNRQGLHCSPHSSTSP